MTASETPVEPGPVMLDPFAPGFFDDPYEQYREIRAAEPVHRTPFGIWALFGYDDVVRVLRDPHLSVEERHGTVPEALLNPEIEALLERRDERGNRAMLNLDPPDHHRLRRLVAKVFTPTAVEALRPRVRALVDEALDAAEARGSMDVIVDLAFPLPFTVISEMMGIPEGRSRTELRSWSHTLVKTLEPVLSVDDLRAAFDAGDQMRAYLDEVIAWRRRVPDDGLLSALLAAEDEGDRLDADELVDQVVLLYIAGHETTVNLVGNGTLALLRHPDQLARLRSDPDLDRNAVEELLRFDSPVQMSRRITLTELEVGGHTIEPGTFVMTSLGAANHDPARFGPDADALALGRADASAHVSFGGGVHHCLGAALARLEGQEAIPRLVRRFPDLALVEERAAWNGRLVLRGLDRLPVSLRG